MVVDSPPVGPVVGRADDLRPVCLRTGFGAPRERWWATDSGVKSAWLEVDFGKRVTFNRAVIKQAYAELDRVKKFGVEYLADGQWKICYQGGKLGARHQARFAPVTAQRVRLNITESTDGPTITEFSLFPPDKRETATPAKRE